MQIQLQHKLEEQVSLEAYPEENTAGVYEVQHVCFPQQIPQHNFHINYALYVPLLIGRPNMARHKNVHVHYGQQQHIQLRTTSGKKSSLPPI